MKVNRRNEFANQLKVVNELAIRLREETTKFDVMVIKKYGCNYSEIDADYIIDNLDYGHGTISSKRFDEEMKSAIKRNKTKQDR